MKRLVGFNLHAHDSLRHFEDTKSPVQLKNIVVKENNECISNQQSAVHKAGLSDVSFSYINQPKLESAAESSAATSVTVSEVKKLHPNQKVNISGSLTMGKEDLKAIVLRSTGATTHVKEDCVLRGQNWLIHDSHMGTTCPYFNNWQLLLLHQPHSQEFPRIYLSEYITKHDSKPYDTNS